MFLILWEYEVKPGYEERFESVYGPRGDWARLFQTDARFRETRLLRDVSRPRWYFTLDYWDSENSFLSFKAANEAAYHALDQTTESLSVSERSLGSFYATS
ncbi:MAG TPA: hypothetical protein VL128_00375 [Candidatus Eisenbacteria bacterium]|nr:hypothetical protein [Candidatus Eisenbacteria bacterium]